MSTISLNNMLIVTNLATSHCSYYQFIKVKLLLKRQATQDRQTDRQIRLCHSSYEPVDKFGPVTVFLRNLWTSENLPYIECGYHIASVRLFKYKPTFSCASTCLREAST